MRDPFLHCPKLRDDLEIVPRVAEGGAFRYYARALDSEDILEFGEQEYRLCRSMDGRRTLSDILSEFEVHAGIPADIAQVAAFVRKLDSLGLLLTGSPSYRPLKPKKILLWNPDRFLGLLAGAIGGCFSLPFGVAAALFIALGFGVAIKHGGALIDELALMRQIFGPLIVLPMAAIGMFVIGPLGELGKGFACKHYGGQVPEFGMILGYRIFPRFFADISDTFWYMAKPVQVRVICSGLILQGLFWSGCLLAWQGTSEGTGLHTFLVFAVTASSVFLFLNLLPLVEKDGYFLLSLSLNIPYLHDRAKSLTKSWVLRKPLPEPLSDRERVIFKRYGLPAYGFDLLFWCLIGLLGQALVESAGGVGACLFLIFLLLRFEDALRRFGFRISFPETMMKSERGASKLRLIIRIGLYMAFIALMFVPYPFEVGGDFTLRPVHEQGIRAQVSGEIDEVYVREGIWVKRHEPVARLIGRDQRKKVEQVKASLDGAQAKLAMLVAGAKPEEIAKARQEVMAATKSLEYSTSQTRRVESMFRDKAISERDYENALRVRDMDRERLESAKKDLELVQSGFRKEQILAAEAEAQRLKVELAHAEEDLELVTMVSPIEGWIITPHLSEKQGQYLITGDLFGVVEDSRKLIADIEVPERDINHVKIGARIKLRTWSYPNTVYGAKVKAIAPVAFEKSRRRIERSFSEREWLIEQNEAIRKEGRVVRVIAELDNEKGSLRTDMTGFAKIESGWHPVAVAYSQWLIRFLFVEVWSWIP